MRLRSIGLLCLSLLLIGCSSRAPLTVAAAASMQRPLQAIAAAFTKQTGQAVTLSFGATGTLAAQIEQGAPFDLFLAANESTPKQLSDKGLLDGAQRYATGQIVLAVAKRVNLSVSTLQDLTRTEIKRIAIANPDQAPYGKAAIDALKAAGVWTQVQSKIVMGENIRQTAQFVESGNAEVGLLARSDADSATLSITPIPGNLYAPIHQALGIIKGSPHEAVAKQFAQFMTTTEAKAILDQYGFALPPN
ncbi:MAG TPA: molybdate ABC transporter substrate-binding protein [Symbiobacteriaceae bacterium]|nr:molybdate ABC transporter substrate-binding protein [Symbiobacteriaceae bacterium]